MDYRSVLAAAVAAALLAPLQANAACKLTTINAPVEVDGLMPKVAVKINGQEVKLLLDSGSYFNAIDAKFAQDQKLKPVQEVVTGSHIGSSVENETIGVGGTRKAGIYVIAPTFEIVHAKFNSVPLMTVNMGGADGLLGQNFLHAFDDEYDLRNGMLRLVQPQDCKTNNLAYWAKAGTAYSVMPLEATDEVNTQAVAYVMINGVKLRAIFDTGAGQSFITNRAAARAGVKVTDPGVKPNGEISGIDRDHIKTWLAPFSSVKIGDEEIKNTQLLIGETNASSFDILIGADFFLSHHIYIANSQSKIYFTYEGGPVFRINSSNNLENSNSAQAGK